jgi:histidinol-phosphate phosphatase family protein
MAIPAIFLDRDGVIIENRPNYVRSMADVEIIQPALAALIWLKTLPYPIIIITNQSAVGRQILSRPQADYINNQLVQTVQMAGGRIDGVYMCPHAPNDHCHCRKPQPGLILQAARDMDLDLKNSIMIGDALTDIQAGQSAGVGHKALVLTGRGEAQLALLKEDQAPTFQIHATLLEAIQNFTDSSFSQNSNKQTHD